MSKAVFAADTHLSAQAWARMPGLVGDAEWAFTQLVDYCIEKQAEALVLAGDLIDKKINDSLPIKCLRVQIDRLQQAAVPVYYIQGQHELADPPWMNSVSDWPQHIHQKMVEVAGLTLYGLDFTIQSDLSEKLARIPYNANTLIAHQVWEEFMGSIAVCQGSLASLPKQIRYCITGDLHCTEIRDITKHAGGTVTVLSPGATHMRKINEPGVHHFFVWDSNLKKFEIGDLQSRDVYRFNIDSRVALKQLQETFDKTFYKLSKETEHYPENLKKPIVQLVYDTSVPDAREKSLAVIGDRAFIFEQPVWPDVDRILIDRSKKDTLVSGGLASCLQLLVEDKESDLYQDTLRLLTETEDVETVVQAIVDRLCDSDK